MIYRCGGCHYEEARGCLPTASCGLYLAGLMILTMGGMLGFMHALRALLLHQLPLPPADAPPPEPPPWWGICIGMPIILIAALIGMMLLDKTLSTVEWLLFARRRCPYCGARQWSSGFTRGFGL